MASEQQQGDGASVQDNAPAQAKAPAASTIKNCKDHIQKIATQLNMSVEDIKRDIESTSLPFLTEVLEALKLRKVTTREGWQPILNSLEHHRQRRRGGKAPKGTSHKAAWQPFEGREVRRLAELHVAKLQQGIMSGDEDLSPPSPMSDLSFDGESYVPPPADTRIVFCGTCPLSDLAEGNDASLHARISVWLSDKRQAGKVVESLTFQELKEMGRSLGLGLCSGPGLKEEERVASASAKKQPKKKRKSTSAPDPAPETLTQHEREVVYIHHVVMAMLWARSTGRVSVAWEKWEGVKEQLDKNSLQTYLATIRERRVILFTPFDGSEWASQDLHQFYDQVRLARDGVTAYPSETEIFGMSSGFQDIEAFDAIAARPDTPPEYAFRPRTCRGEGSCSLADYDGRVAYRRTFGGLGENNVRVGNSSDARLGSSLKCTRPGEEAAEHTTQPYDQDSQARSGPPKRHFHQEHVASIDEWGICRVYMAGNDILKIALSRPPKDGESRTDELRADVAFEFLDKPGPCSVEQEARNQRRRDKKLEEVKQCCRWWRKKLLEHKPDQFASLAVGVRFDICLSETSRDAKFFIAEAKRWPVAHGFGDSLVGFPYDFFCRAFGIEFAKRHGGVVAAGSVPDSSTGSEDE